MRPLLIYLHGFLSSSLSEKAEQTRRYIDQQSLPIDFVAPTLANYPMAMYVQLQRLIEQQPKRRIGLVGSSLGGFLATALAEKYDLPAVLINPAVHADRLIANLLGAQHNPYTGENFVLDASHVAELQQLSVHKLTRPENLLVLLQTGDETLDYRLALDYYHGCRQTVEQGGDHRFQHYQQHLPDVFNFLALTQSNRE